MNAQPRRITILFLIILPLFLLACSFTVSANGGVDLAKKTPTPTLDAFAQNACPQLACDCPLIPTPEPTRACGSADSRQPAGAGQAVSSTLGTNVAQDKPVISRAGGITYPDWGGANDGNDYGTTTRAQNGRWGHQTNTEGGAYEVVDLGREYTLTGVGYALDWDGAFANPLTVQVLVSTDNETWTMVANTVHRYAGGGVGNHMDVDLAIVPASARYVKYWQPPDGAWNGWGDYFQLRAYAE